MMVASREFSGSDNINGKEKIAAHAEAKGWGKKQFVIACAIGVYRASVTGERRFRSFTAIDAARCLCPKANLPVVLPKDVPFTGERRIAAAGK